MKIAEYLPSHASTWGEITPEALERGLGGRETAALNLAMQWARAEHQVHVFTNVEEASYLDYGRGKLFFIPQGYAGGFLSTTPYDACLSWEAPELFINEAIRRRCKAMVCGMQVAHVMQQQARRAPDVWVALSPWHRDFLEPQLAPGTMIEVIPNGVNLQRFHLPQHHQRPANVDMAPEMFRPTPRFIYSSSPDRGLHHLLDAWPLILAAFPSASLDVCYGIERWLEEARWLHNSMGIMAHEIEKGLDQDGVFYRGKVGQAELARLMMGAQALLYPCDTLAPTETGCITIMEALAAGAAVVTTDCDCIGSEFGDVAEIVPLPWNARQYVDRIVDLFEGDLMVQRRQAGYRFMESRSWEVLSQHWLDLFEHLGQHTNRSYGLRVA